MMVLSYRSNLHHLMRFEILISFIINGFVGIDYSLIVTLCRKFIISLPLIILLKGTFGISIVWWSILISEIITIIISIILFRKAFKKINITSN